MNYHLIDTFNPLSGKNSPGIRFPFRVRSIAHKNLYLPIEMMATPQIRLLLDGASPLDVFGCENLDLARSRFNLLRMRYDFPYWAALNFHVPDKASPQSKVPLVLNIHQRFIADILIRRSNAGLPGKYFVTKSTPQVGLTTCIQAYILWNQLHRYPHHSITCSPDILCTDRLKYSLARQLGRKASSSDLKLDERIKASFLSFYESYELIGHRAGYLHLADMLKWYDPDAESSRQIFSRASSCWCKDRFALMILEGDTPLCDGFRPEDFRNYLIKESIRLHSIGTFFNNPYFVNLHVMLSDSRVSSDFHLIDLDKA